MDITVKFEGIDYRSGKKRKFKHTFECDINFVEKRNPNRFKEQLLGDSKSSLGAESIKMALEMEDEVITDVYSQAEEWVDERDNMDIIHQYNLASIWNYEVIKVGEHSKKNDSKIALQKELAIIGDSRIAKGGDYHIPKHNLEAEKVVIMMDYYIKDEQMKLDMFACYKEMYTTIKKMGARKQFHIVLKSVGIAYKSATTALDKLSEYGKMLDAIPRHVWKAAMSQGNVKTDDFIRSYIKGTLNEKQLRQIEDRTPKQLKEEN